MSTSYSLPHTLILGPPEPDDADREWRIVHPIGCPWQAVHLNSTVHFAVEIREGWYFHRDCGVQYEIEGLGLQAVREAFESCWPPHDAMAEGKHQIRSWHTHSPSNPCNGGDEYDGGLELILEEAA